MKFFTLTKENVSSIDIQCGKPRIYYKYEMNFLKKPMIYAFQDPVKVEKCTYSMLMTGISNNDQETLNELFMRINSLMDIGDASFIAANDEIVYENSKKSMLTVEILGFKKLENNVAPIWKVKNVQKIN